MRLEHGIYNIYKPAGPTSHDMVDLVRRLSGERRVGHAGTLDPFAEGVLIVAIGREYTKQLGGFLKQDKTYEATLKLGASSDTGDLTGHCTTSNVVQWPECEEVTAVLKKFTGEIMQIPPIYSALKIKGEKAYELARRGAPVALAPRPVTVYSIKLLSYHWPHLTIRTKVSSGTYIRSLAQAIGAALNTGAYLEKLVRTEIGEFTSQQAIKLAASPKTLLSTEGIDN